MGYKVGDKFIIEIGAIAELPDGKKKYFIKPFESLVFDKKGLDQLERVKEPKEEFRVGDEVKDGFENVGIVTNLPKHEPEGMWILRADGKPAIVSKSGCTKTGRKFVIPELLDALRTAKRLED